MHINLFLFRVGTLAAILVPAVSSAQTVPSGLRDFARAIKSSAGVTPVLPLSTQYQPGFIYREVSANGSIVRRIVCEVAFRQPPIENALAIPTTHTFRDSGFNVGLGFVPPSTAADAKAKLGVALGSVRNVELTFSGVKAFEVPPFFTSNPTDGQPVETTLTSACAKSLDKLEVVGPKHNRRFRERVFIVTKALSASTLSYSLDKTGTAGVDLTAGINAPTVGTVDLVGGWKMKRTSKQSLELTAADGSRQLYFGADIVRLVNATLPGFVSATLTEEQRSTRRLKVQRVPDSNISLGTVLAQE